MKLTIEDSVAALRQEVKELKDIVQAQGIAIQDLTKTINQLRRVSG